LERDFNIFWNLPSNTDRSRESPNIQSRNRERHKTFADQWNTIVQDAKGYIKADDDDLYYTSNLAFDFSELHNVDRIIIIEQCTNFYQKVFSGNFESYFK
jgi:hypothetical protein